MKERNIMNCKALTYHYSYLALCQSGFVITYKTNLNQQNKLN